MIKGFIVGSFRPFHKGHEALIDYAKSNCDELTILITTLPDEEIPYKYRLKWVLSTYLDDPQINIIADIISEPELKGDELSVWWGNYVKEKHGIFDRVFTSEDYGDVFAFTMGAEHWKFDKARTIVPVSATMIRHKPITNWNYINNFAKDYFVKKFVILGTESTGKTYLTQKLAEHYHTQWCPEVRRDIVSNAEFATWDDFNIIATTHAKNILRYTRLSNKLLFIDTDLNITKSYAHFLFNRIPDYEPWVEKANEAHFYIYLDKAAPYIDDGSRLSEDKRDYLDKCHRKMLEDNGIKYQRFHFYSPVGESTIQDSYDKRFKEIIEYIDWEISKL